MDKAILDSERLGLEAEEQIDAAFSVANIIDPILERHKATLDRIQKYNEQGKRGLARSLLRSSGLLDDLAKAIAGAGKKASQAVQRQRIDILEVMADDNGS